MESYQEAIHVGYVEPGDRASDERWELIRDHAPANGLVLDVGSNLGYFGLRLTQSNERLAVVSLESSAVIADRQRRLLQEHAADRICLVQGRLDAETARTWAATCDWFELTLALSVLHWVDDPAAVLRDLSAMSATLIAEVPDEQDSGACGRRHLETWGSDPVAWFREQTGRDCQLLARVGRHTSEVRSHLILVQGPVERHPIVPYWGYDYDRPTAGNYHVAYDGDRVQLSVRGAPVDYVPGINLLSLMRLGTLVHPAVPYWEASARAAIEAAPAHGDPYPHNMIWTPDGLHLIDPSDLDVERSTDMAMASLARNLVAWQRGRTRRYVREVLSPTRRLRRLLGRAARAVVGDRLVDRAKRWAAAMWRRDR